MTTSIYKLRVILDAEADVFRDLELPSDFTLEQLLAAITQSFNLETGEMGSFYISDEDWNQGTEISMEDFGEPGGLLMRDVTVAVGFPEHYSRLILVYDFLAMWTFFVELVSIRKGDTGTYPQEVLRFGERPDQAPEKMFGSDTHQKNIFDDAFDEEDDFSEEDDAW
ncbi:MAG: plasmid pRiA4b ORF-3 family protein [Schleiferiaceae bacterium]|nr:plasmid pRiA4b ORF-3 family protein [Schleiferiaceae bacterium]